MLPQLTEADFHVFQIEGLEPRMEALREQIQPKLTKYGDIIASHLTLELQNPFYPHVAKHIRRTVNPPDHTWVAWSTHSRGYKAQPHFQFGLRDTYVFAWFAIMNEFKEKSDFAKRLIDQFDPIWEQLPIHFEISPDHHKEETISLTQLGKTGLLELIHRLQQIKKAEFYCGLILPKKQVLALPGEDLIQQVEASFDQLKPLYQVAVTGKQVSHN